MLWLKIQIRRLNFDFPIQSSSAKFENFNAMKEIFLTGKYIMEMSSSQCQNTEHLCFAFLLITSSLLNIFAHPDCQLSVLNYSGNTGHSTTCCPKP
mmetsp:Transcript_2648/g.3409  ORF Transcript_2648/g.3409 Transcript_2648/m.3409 type:complete len:96 (+) Transcript_2648:257-544(+)